MAVNIEDALPDQLLVNIFDLLTSEELIGGAGLVNKR
jgi:hypothetical protein